jgi:ribosomal protein uL22
MEYAYQQKRKELRIARARLTGVNASYKDLCEVCSNVRGKPTDYALEFLSRAANGEAAIYFARHNKGKGHRRELGGRMGGWPVKSARFVLEVVANAAANANKLGLASTRLAHVMANKQDTFPRMSPKGKRIRQDYETAFIEVVLEEVQETAETKKADAPKANEAKKEAKKEAPKATEAKKAEAKRADVPKANETKKAEAPKAATAQS